MIHIFISQGCGACAASIGFVAILGWLTGYRLLAGLGSLVPMAPSTAVLFIAYGSAVFFRARNPQSRKACWIKMTIGLTGVLVLRTDPQKYLYPFIKRWPTPSRTAENLILPREGNDALFFNELGFRKNTALNLRTSLKNIHMPAVKAAIGGVG